LNSANLKAIQHTKTQKKSIFHKEKRPWKKFKRETVGLSPKLKGKHREVSFYYKYMPDCLQIESGMFCSTCGFYFALFLIVNKL